MKEVNVSIIHDSKSNEVLTTQQAAMLIGISQHGVIKAIHRGLISATKIGKKRTGIWLIAQDEAERYRDERKSPGRPRKETEMSKYQVCYDGKNWESVEDESRMKRILANHFTDIVYPMKELEQGQEVRTTFSAYRKDPTK